MGITDGMLICTWQVYLSPLPPGPSTGKDDSPNKLSPAEFDTETWIPSFSFQLGPWAEQPDSQGEPEFLHVLSSEERERGEKKRVSESGA